MTLWKKRVSDQLSQIEE